MPEPKSPGRLNQPGVVSVSAGATATRTAHRRSANRVPRASASKLTSKVIGAMVMVSKPHRFSPPAISAPAPPPVSMRMPYSPVL